ncbi:AraC family transcriptional regulator [Schleiferilactobacillus shenzhenensis]|uniref:HTH araC/xylS-type domain-containing protein n=1 Tax=Schleiferilactobacillus shenzhenensis LY-73 TaxID=1231336 RepID=U4TKM2_9LACO|nr:helix-turn-helix domain-containing protein [Schleiferilactobacillus shenzhenensis]ERL64759.1 hypothetical protein L248_0678 [Schleiferilactobacillus shenzhenensis LY-73]
MQAALLKRLEALTPVEIAQRKNHIVGDDIPPTALDLTQTQRQKVPVLNDYFFRNCSIYVSKHNRFAPYPLHTHQFLEVNYMVRGQAHETVNGQPVDLTAGDVLLLDVGSKHAIDALGEDDIMMNILFQDRNISLNLLHQIQSTQSVLNDFVLNQVGSENDNGGYLLFHRTSATQVIQDTLDRIIAEYYRDTFLSDTIVQAYLTILIAELVRHSEVKPANISPGQHMAVQMLADIRAHYQDLTLEQLADKYAYNKNYLGNLFHKEVGKTFSQALTEERLIHAREMIQTTNKPIADISLAVGMTNKSFFYRKYAAKFGKTPKQDRVSTHPASIAEQLTRFV